VPGFAETSQLCIADQSPLDVLVEKRTEVHIQLSERVAASLTAGVDMALFARRIGLGRVRADLSTPLTPPADKIRITDADGDARLVMRIGSRPGDVAVVQLGRLDEGSRRMADGFGGIRVVLCVGEKYLPRFTIEKLQWEQQHKRVWGAVVECTAEPTPPLEVGPGNPSSNSG
jgi:hypothetical protein